MLSSKFALTTRIVEFIPIKIVGPFDCSSRIMLLYSRN